MQHFGPHTVDDCKRNLRPVLRRIDMDAQRTFAEGGVHDLHDCFCNCTCIGILWNDGGKGLLDSLSVSFIWPCLVLAGALLVGRHSRMREMVSAPGECSGHDDRSFNAPECQLAGILDGQGIHTSLRRKVRREVGRRAACDAAARYPDQQPACLLS